MYPCIRPGDFLVIKTRPLSQVRIGDIAVCRRPDYLFGHRVIMKGIDREKTYIITRPDRSEKGDDGPTYAQDVLGVVIEIQRRGRQVSLSPNKHTFFQRLILWAQLLLHQSKPALSHGFIKFLAIFQKGPVYRLLAQTWLAAAHIRLIFEVRLPFPSDSLKNFYHPIPPDAFDMAKMNWHGAPITLWTLALTPLHSRQPAARATFVLDQDGQNSAWRLDDLHVRVRYRGVGLENKLIRRAAELIAQGDASLQRGEH